MARGVTRGYRRADSRSPLRRNDRNDPRDIGDWRRPPPAAVPAARSPSPPRASRQPYDDYEERGRESVATSRRSSPPRAAAQAPVDDRTSRPAPRDPYESREPYRAPRSPRARDPSPPPVTGDRDYPAERSYDQEDRIPPPREPYRADDMPVRAPPTGPSSGGYRAPSSSSMAPPTGPAAAAVSVSAHARAPAAPPSGPRGDMPPRGGFGGPRGRGGFGGDFAPRGRGGFGGPGFRGGRGGGPPPGGFGRGQGYVEREQQDFTPHQGPPSGPRGSFSSQGPPPPFRQNSNSTATTYPRSQRFAPNGQAIPDTPTGPRNAQTASASTPTSYRRPTEPSIPTGPSNANISNNNIPSGPASDRRRESEIHNSLSNQQPSNNVHPALRDLPPIIPGGRKASPKIDRSRLDKLDDDAEKLRAQIKEKEEKKRKALREWERMSRESKTAGLRSELADDSVRAFADDEVMGAAF